MKKKETHKTLDEIETHLNMTAANHREWEAFSEDPFFQRRMEKIGVPVQRATKDGKGKFYILSSKNISFRKIVRSQLTAEEREKLAARMRKMREQMGERGKKEEEEE